MNDPFEHHGVTHLSASSINEYIQNPARWLLHVSGFRDNAGIPAMWRGTAVDKAITSALLDDLSDNEALLQAQESFRDEKAHAIANDQPVNEKKAQAESEAVARYLKIALPFYRKLGPPIESQKKITLEYEWMPVPIIGYIDLKYDGVVRDIKTVGRLPTSVPFTVCRQLSIYAKAENAMPLVDYVHSTKTSSQVVVMPVPDVDYHLKFVEQASRSMMRLLSYSSDIREVAQLLTPNFDDWRWSSAEIQAATKLWSL